MKILSTVTFCALVTTISAQTQDVEVVEFHPAPGQFVNELPSAEEDETHESICQKATQQLRDSMLLHLGAFGGYVTVRFDHPIENKRGSDLRITGNAFYAEKDPMYGTETIGGSIEPGIVYAGVGSSPETATWYELAGSEYYTTETHDFTITYHKPTHETGSHTLPASICDDYIRWEATWTQNGERRDSTGYHPKLSFHQQTYWPLWEKGNEMTFRGGRVPNNAIDQSGKGTYWVLYRYANDAYGYVDASLRDDDYATFDLDWAVDSMGQHVALDHADYIRVQTAIFQHCGWLGETSTEVGSFTDLHLLAGYDDNPIIITPRTTDDIHSTTVPQRGTATYYNLTGQKVSHPIKGNIYIQNGKKRVF